MMNDAVDKIPLSAPSAKAQIPKIKVIVGFWLRLFLAYLKLPIEPPPKTIERTNNGMFKSENANALEA